MSHHRDEERDAWAAVIQSVFGPVDPVRLDKEAHAIPVLAAELKELCQRIGAATDLSEPEVTQLASGLLSGRITIEDATCTCQ